MSTEPPPEGTAIEQFFNQLINMLLLSQVVVSDKEGNTVLACFGSPEKLSPTLRGTAAAPSTGNDPLEDPDMEEPMESNVVLSGARCFQVMEQLRVPTPRYMVHQYHDAVVLQTTDGHCILTLIGYRSQGHFAGGLLALLPRIRATPVYTEMIQKVSECFQ